MLPVALPVELQGVRARGTVGAAAGVTASLPPTMTSQRPEGYPQQQQQASSLSSASSSSSAGSSSSGGSSGGSSCSSSSSSPGLRPQRKVRGLPADWLANRLVMQITADSATPPTHTPYPTQPVTRTTDPPLHSHPVFIPSALRSRSTAWACQTDAGAAAAAAGAAAEAAAAAAAASSSPS